MKRFFKAINKSITVTYNTMLILFGLYLTLCVLIKQTNEINWYEYVGVIGMIFIAIGLAQKLFTKLKASNNVITSEDNKPTIL